MNKRSGFTLIELIICLIVVGLIMIFVVPKINETILNKKKDKMIEDAKLFVEKTKEYIEMNDNAIKESYGVFELKLIDPKKELLKSPFGEKYGRKYQTIQPYASYTLVGNDSNNNYKYGVCLTDGKYTLYIRDISELNSNNKYDKIKKYSFGDCEPF